MKVVKLLRRQQARRMEAVTPQCSESETRSNSGQPDSRVKNFTILE